MCAFEIREIEEKLGKENFEEIMAEEYFKFYDKY